MNDRRLSRQAHQGLRRRETGEIFLWNRAISTLKLDRLEVATALKDLGALPGNHFEALAGDRKGQYSIRINDQWRLCFEWSEGAMGPANVEIVDYH